MVVAKGWSLQKDDGVTLEKLARVCEEVSVEAEIIGDANRALYFFS